MLNFLGAMLLLLGSSGIGISAIKRLEQRTSTLRSLADALALMGKELVFSMPPMQELLIDTARRASRPAEVFLRRCAEEMVTCEGVRFSEIWSKAAATTLIGLKKSDYEILNTVGNVLGRFDVDGQRSAIDTACEQLKRCSVQAAEDRNRQGKVYGTLGIAAGAFLVILLM